MQAYTLKKEIRGAKFYHDEEQDRFVGLVPLEEALFDELNDYFIRQQIGFDECDILVEAITESKSTEITVPHVVNKMLKYIDCQLTYVVSGSEA